MRLSLNERRRVIAEVAEVAGIVFPGAMDLLPRHEIGGNGGREWGALDEAALDAQPTLITQPNAGIPAMLTTYLDPKVIEVLLTPNNAVKLYGETRKGNWLDDTAYFPMVEYTGEVSSYGDFNNNGRAGANAQYVPRQAYLFQTWTEWGEREAERMGLGKIGWAARLNIASGVVLTKFMNQLYFYGIANLANNGSLNDPALSAALTPGTKAAGGTSWNNALPTEILADIQSAFAELQTQTGSNLELDTKMTLGLHSISEMRLGNTNSFGLTAIEMIRKVFPNIRIQQAPQFLSNGVYSFQLFVDELDGQRTVECAFNEKMRAHRMETYTSSWRQKKTCGGWGTIWYFPAGVASMSGI